MADRSLHLLLACAVEMSAGALNVNQKNPCPAGANGSECELELHSVLDVNGVCSKTVEVSNQKVTYTEWRQVRNSGGLIGKRTESGGSHTAVDYKTAVAKSGFELNQLTFVWSCPKCNRLQMCKDDGVLQPDQRVVPDIPSLAKLDASRSDV